MPDHNDRDDVSRRGRAASVAGGISRQPGSAPLDRPTQDRLGFALRSLYDGLMDEPVPDRLTDLIRRLDGGKGH